MSRIAIFGGTFNPLHIGHYQIISELSNNDFIDKVIVIPTMIPPHKVCSEMASAQDRLMMCRLACEDFKKVVVSDIEIKRQGKSYSIDTVRELKKLYPYDKFYLTVGGDMLSSLDKWHKWQELIKEVSFIAFERKGTDSAEKSAQRMREYGADINIIKADIADISSTELRFKINRELLPEKVYMYIKERKLYSSGL